MDTFGAIVQSIKVIVDFIIFALDILAKRLPITFVLPGMLQTDDLEHRFGSYRNLAGCSYHITVSELLESEKKIRLRNIFCNYSDFVGEFKLPVENDPIIASVFIHSLSPDYLTKSKVDLSVLTYVSGYAAHTIGKTVNCNSCADLIRDNNNIDVGNTYFDSLQRGGLSMPTDAVCETFQHVYAVFEDIIKNTASKNSFFNETKNKQLLGLMTIKSLDSIGFF